MNCIHSVIWSVNGMVFDIFAHLNYNEMNQNKRHETETECFLSWKWKWEKKQRIKPLKVDGLKKN